MRISDFDDFDSVATEGLLAGSRERSWLWFGLIVSLGLHAALCTYFYRTHFQSVAAVIVPSEQTPTFKVKSIVDSNLEKSSVDQTNPAAKPEPEDEPGRETGARQNGCAVAGRKKIVRQTITGHSSERGAAG